MRGSSLLPALLAAVFAGGGSPLSASFIIWAVSGWFCFSRRIRVISRVNAAGSSTSAFASASGLSRTMAMSISPPSLWIMVGRPACTSARIATVFTQSALPFLQGSLRWSVSLWWDLESSCSLTLSERSYHFFFRPTPCGFRQVVQQLSKTVANEINYLIRTGAVPVVAAKVNWKRTDT